MSPVTTAYRNLLRVQRATFGADVQTLTAARIKTRQEFQKHKEDSDPAIIQQQLQLAEDVTNLLKRNIVQGVAKDEDPSTYRLRFNPETELGDNGSITNAKNSQRKRSKAST